MKLIKLESFDTVFVLTFKHAKIYQSSPRPPVYVFLLCWICALRCCSNFGQLEIRCPRPPQNVHSWAAPSVPLSFSLGSSMLSRNGGIFCFASRSRCFKSRRISSDDNRLMNVVAIPVLPLRPVLPILWTSFIIRSEEWRMQTVIFNFLGHVVVDNMLDLVEIQAFGRNVCSD